MMRRPGLGYFIIRPANLRSGRVTAICDRNLARIELRDLPNFIAPIGAASL